MGFLLLISQGSVLLRTSGQASAVQLSQCVITSHIGIMKGKYYELNCSKYKFLFLRSSFGCLDGFGVTRPYF